MSFERFHHSFLMDEASGDPNGGGAPAATAGQPAAPAAPAFDPAAFRNELKVELLNEIRKDINGVDRKFKKEFETFHNGFNSFKTELQSWLKPAEPAEPASNDPAPAPAPTPAAQPNAPAQPNAQQPAKPSPEVLRLQKQLEELQKAHTQRDEELKKEKAELAKKELATALKGEIGLYQFAAPTGQQDLFNLLRDSIIRGDDGQFYGPDGVTLAEYVKNEWTARPTWQPAKQVGGSGAPAPQTVNGRIAFDDSLIKPGMTAEDAAKARQAILQVLNVS